ncbi:MAG: hypothetical protein GY859_32980, partial [Desulfobacterales bacterium]|nr:hypothetical protein [Desulfobacterales bacterium]
IPGEPGPISREKAAPGLNEHLEKLKFISGFQLVGVFTPLGEIIAEVSVTDLDAAEMGALANEALTKSRDITESMGLGRGGMIHIEALKAQVIARCYSEHEDPDKGGAHFHVILILDRNCNLAMAKMKLESVIKELAPHFN